MKKFLLLLSILCCGAYADTINLRFVNEDDTTYETKTCTVGGDVILPSTTPSKRGYNFVGWKIPKYIPIEYLENTPSETYLNTGFYPTENSKVVVDFIQLQYGSGECPVIVNSTHLLGVTGGLNTEYPTHTILWFNGGYTYCSQCSRTRKQHTVNKNTVSGQQNAYFTSATPMFIFSENANSPTSCTIRIFSIQLYQNNILVHDYVPALDLAGVAGLYDKVSEEFLYNAGTGEFVTGPIIDYD